MGDALLRAILDEHDVHATVGENIGTPRSPVPTAGYTWHPTRPPVAHRAGGRTRVTRGRRTRPSDAGTRAPAISPAAGETYPLAQARPSGCAASTCRRARAPRSRWRWTSRACRATCRCCGAHGWTVADPRAVSADPFRYRDYLRQLAGRVHGGEGPEHPAAQRVVQRSRGLLPRGRPASGRAGHRLRRRPAARPRPARVPHGRGGGATPSQAIEADYARASAHAAAVARECFAADRVVGGLLELVGL